MTGSADMAGRVVLVTGGASGLGLATARELARRGARLALVDLDLATTEAAAATVRPGTLALAADTTDVPAITYALQQAADHFGRLDVVMANAGVGWAGMALTMDPERYERLVEINLLGTWRTTRAALPHLLASRGYLLIVASAAALLPGPGMSAYSLSKAGVESLGRSLRVELAHHGVDVGVAYYTFLDTPMVAAMQHDPAAGRLKAALPGPVRRTYPLHKAVRVTADGIARRSARIAYPRFVRAVLLLRGLAGPRSERAAEAVMPEVERLAREGDTTSATPSAVTAIPTRDSGASRSPSSR